MQTLQTDVLVIGAGAGGMRAALEARLAGAQVTLAVKGRFAAIGVRGAGASACALDGAGAGLFTGDIDSPPTAEQAYSENIQLGLGLSDPRLARILVEDSLRNRSELAALNIHPKRGFGWGVNSHGVPLVTGLAGQIRSRGVTIREGLMLTRLMVRDGECVGALGVSEADGGIVAIQAGAVVLATGGDGQIFLHNVNPSCVTGDGYAMGYEAGAGLMNLEFKQVFVSSIYPTRNLLHLWVWKRPLRLLNARNEEFLAHYCPPGATPEQVFEEHSSHDPASTRDRLSRYLEASIVGEVVAGRGTPRAGIWIDARGLEHVLEPTVAEWLRYRGIHSNDELIEASICHQCSNGGFRVDENAQTTISGLYAVGECMAGAYGADRRGGNMLASTQVFGARAGRHAARRSRGRSRADIPQGDLTSLNDDLASLRQAQGAEPPSRLKRALQELNWRDLLFVRSAEGLTRVLCETRRLRDETAAHLLVRSPQDVIEALELRNMLLVTEMVAAAALTRQETRGAHYRVDFPQRNDRDWRKNITLRKVGADMRVGTIVLDPDWQDREANASGFRWG